MNEDYLWDKTGENAEIERLETVLQSLCYKETAAPPIPEITAKVLPFQQIRPKPARKLFQSAYAVAACAAFIAVALSIWLQVLRNDTPVNQDSAGAIETEKSVFTAEKIVLSAEESIISVNDGAAENPSGSSAEKSEVSVAKKSESLKQPAESNTVQLRKNIQSNVFQKKSKNEIIRAEKKEIKLTKEEQYAYDQLRLALSIAGSKLKLVKNKAESVEEKTAEGTGGR